MKSEILILMIALTGCLCACQQEDELEPLDVTNSLPLHPMPRTRKRNSRRIFIIPPDVISFSTIRSDTNTRERMRTESLIMKQNF